MNEELRELMWQYLRDIKKPEGFDVNLVYDDDALLAFVSSKEVANFFEVLAETAPKELPEGAPGFIFSLTLRDIRPEIKGLNAEDAEERFLNKTLKEIGATRANYKIM